MKSLLSPPEIRLTEHRAIDQVFSAPHVTFADPDALNYRDTMLPTTPGAPVTTGLMQVAYDGQPLYDRSRVEQAGPVRAFFRSMIAAKKKTRQP